MASWAHKPLRTWVFPHFRLPVIALAVSFSVQGLSRSLQWQNTQHWEEAFLHGPCSDGNVMSFCLWPGVFPHSSTLAWKIPWTEEPGRLQSMWSRRVRHDWATSLSLACIGEGNGNTLQCSCLENFRDGGAWWAAVYGVIQSQTPLKWLSSSSRGVSPGKGLCWLLMHTWCKALFQS